MKYSVPILIITFTLFVQAKITLFDLSCGYSRGPQLKRVYNEKGEIVGGYSKHKYRGINDNDGKVTFYSNTYLNAMYQRHDTLLVRSGDSLHLIHTSGDTLKSFKSPLFAQAFFLGNNKVLFHKSPGQSLNDLCIMDLKTGAVSDTMKASGNVAFDTRFLYLTHKEGKQYFLRKYEKYSMHLVDSVELPARPVSKAVLKGNQLYMINFYKAPKTYSFTLLLTRINTDKMTESRVSIPLDSRNSSSTYYPFVLIDHPEYLGAIAPMGNKNLLFFKENEQGEIVFKKFPVGKKMYDQDVAVYRDSLYLTASKTIYSFDLKSDLMHAERCYLPQKFKPALFKEEHLGYAGYDAILLEDDTPESFEKTKILAYPWEHGGELKQGKMSDNPWCFKKGEVILLFDGLTRIRQIRLHNCILKGPVSINISGKNLKIKSTATVDSEGSMALLDGSVITDSLKINILPNGPDFSTIGSITFE